MKGASCVVCKLLYCFDVTAQQLISSDELESFHDLFIYSLKEEINTDHWPTRLQEHNSLATTSIINKNSHFVTKFLILQYNLSEIPLIFQVEKEIFLCFRMLNKTLF